MPSASFTARWCETVKPRASRTVYFDQKCKGLALRVQPSGTKSFAVVYRVGQQRKLVWQTLGTYPDISLADAREQAGDIRRAARKGRNPAHAAQEKRAAPTVVELFDLWREKHLPTLRSRTEVERAMRKDVLPILGPLKAVSLRRRDVRTVTEAVIERGAPASANLLQAYIKSMFTWAVDQDYLAAHPFIRMKRPHRPHRRDRVLSESELNLLWRLLDTGTPGTAATRSALKLVLATAQRPGEVVQAAWEEFDLDSGWWTIPEGRSKNKMAHRVWINAPARNVLATLPREGAFLFPARTRSRRNTTLTSNVLAHVARRIRRTEAGQAMAHWTPHDLRRTAASLMTGAGIPRLTVKKILNHADPDVTAVYDRHSYDPEKRRALEAWGRKLERIVSGRKAESGDVTRIA